nr:transcription initiation factor TFIID subunit 14b-like [Ipomoea trifida]
MAIRVPSVTHSSRILRKFSSRDIPKGHIAVYVGQDDQKKRYCLSGLTILCSEDAFVHLTPGLRKKPRGQLKQQSFNLHIFRVVPDEKTCMILPEGHFAVYACCRKLKEAIIFVVTKSFLNKQFGNLKALKHDLLENVTVRNYSMKVESSTLETHPRMIQNSSVKKHGSDQSDVAGPTPRSQRTKIVKSSDDNERKSLTKKVKDLEISVPIVYGNIAFWLGKKASEYQSHRWTVYVRGATNEDLGVVVKRAVFQLHSSFNNPTRVVEVPPFEVSECGWGEFEIAITLHFHSDVCDKPLHLYHQLKLYPEDESGPLSIKKPVVVETYDEIVLFEPSETFLARVQNHPAVSVPRLPSGFTLPPAAPLEDIDKRKRGDTKDHPQSQWFTNFSEADELLKLTAARQQVQGHIARLRRQMSLIEGQNQQLKSVTEF